MLTSVPTSLTCSSGGIVGLPPRSSTRLLPVVSCSIRAGRTSTPYAHAHACAHRGPLLYAHTYAYAYRLSPRLSLPYPQILCPYRSHPHARLIADLSIKSQHIPCACTHNVAFLRAGRCRPSPLSLERPASRAILCSSMAATRFGPHIRTGSETHTIPAHFAYIQRSMHNVH